MGIELIIDETRVEFRKELMLPNDLICQHLTEGLKRGEFYKFDLEGYVIFPLGKAMSLFEDGSSNPVASIEITEQRNSLLGGRHHTNREYFIRLC